MSQLGRDGKAERFTLPGACIVKALTNVCGRVWDNKLCVAQKTWRIQGH